MYDNNASYMFRMYVYVLLDSDTDFKGYINTLLDLHYMCLDSANLSCFCSCPLLVESSDGHVHRRLPAVPAEHPGRHPLPENDVDCWHSGHPGVLHHRGHVLLLCECLARLTHGFH